MGLIQTAYRLIARFGQSAIIIRPTGFFPDGAGGLLPPAFNLQFPATVAVVRNDHLLRASSGFQAEDIRVLMAVEPQDQEPQPFAQAEEPKPLDRLWIGGTTLNIIEVSPLGLDGRVVFWDMKARNA